MSTRANFYETNTGAGTRENVSMRKKLFSFFEVVAKTATSKDDQRSFLLGAIAVRKDGTLVKSLNGPSQYPARKAHAEYRLAKKLDIGATVYICRVRLVDGAFANSKPCTSCMNVLRSKKVKRIYYTISNNEYGVIDL